MGGSYQRWQGFASEIDRITWYVEMSTPLAGVGLTHVQCGQTLVPRCPFLPYVITVPVVWTPCGQNRSSLECLHAEGSGTKWQSSSDDDKRGASYKTKDHHANIIPSTFPKDEMKNANLSRFGS